MPKLVKFLEQNVQWIVLGLAGVFLLFMVWSYVLQPPVTIPVGNQTLLPGEVADAIVKGPVEDIRRDIEKTEVPPMPMPDFVGQFVSNMKGGEVELLVWSPFYPAAEFQATGIQDPDGPKNFPVKSLPE